MNAIHTLLYIDIHIHKYVSMYVRQHIMKEIVKERIIKTMNVEDHSLNFKVIHNVAINKMIPNAEDFSSILQNSFPKINDLQTL